MTGPYDLLLPSVFSGLLCSVLHWSAEQLSHGQLGALPRYVLGTVAIGASYGVWCAVQPAEIPASRAFFAWLAVAMGAGVGTGLAYLVDYVAGQARLVRVLENQLGEETQGTRAIVRRE